jgi:hypothetical protein
MLGGIYTPLGLIIRKANVAEYEVLVMHGIVEKGWLNDNRNSMIPSYTVHWTRDDGRSFYGRNVPKYSLRLIGDNK